MRLTPKAGDLAINCRVTNPTVRRGYREGLGIRSREMMILFYQKHAGRSDYCVRLDNGKNSWRTWYYRDDCCTIIPRPTQ